jgi:hypothetical protein
MPPLGAGLGSEALGLQQQLLLLLQGLAGSEAPGLWSPSGLGLRIKAGPKTAECC